MTDPTVSPAKPAVPTTPMASLVQRGLIAASGVVTGVILTWLNAHGFNDPNLNLMISGAVFSALSAIALMGWGWFKTTQLGNIIAERETLAVQAGAAVGIASAESAGPTVDPASLTKSVAKNIISTFAPAPAPK